MKTYAELTINAQNAYADLFSATASAALARSIANLNGSFATKRVGGKVYWYFQYRDIDSAVRQVYVGPDSRAVQALIKTAQTRQTQRHALQLLAQAAGILGCETVLPKHFRVIRRLSEYGFFACGGILVGTHAFMAMGNMLGIIPGERMQTQDLDFAHAGKNISLALPANIEIKTHDAIESLQMGLLPMTTFQGQFGATYVDPQNPSFRLDFLTSQTSARNEPVFVKDLSVALQPMKFLGFIMRDPVQAALFCREGSILVNIPEPERFAIHKLIVAAERPVSETAKIRKDLRQAGVLIEYFLDIESDRLLEVIQEAQNNGPGWRNRLERGLALHGKVNGEELLARLRAALESTSCRASASSRQKSRTHP